MKSSIRSCLALALAPLLLLAACGKEDANKKAATQVAAKVNGDEITVHQINNVLARTPNVTPELAPRAKREILDRLIDQQLAKQQAIEKKLDRTPNIVQAIEAAKIEILARAYLEQLAANQPKPTPEEVKKYYSEHPELFAQRGIFHIEEIVTRSKEGLVAGLRDQATKTLSMQAIANWLKSKNAEFGYSERIIAAEEIPLQSLRTLQATKVGDIQVVDGKDRISIWRIVGTRAAPVDEAATIPHIQQFLYNLRSNEIVGKQFKELKDKAKIEYVGEFAGGVVAPTAPAAAKAETPPTPQASAPNFEKGLK